MMFRELLELLQDCADNKYSFRRRNNNKSTVRTQYSLINSQLMYLQQIYKML